MTGVVELMDDVLESHEKDGLRPVNEKRLRRIGRPMLVYRHPFELVITIWIESGLANGDTMN